MLERLLALDDHDFVRAAYRTLLKREVDPSGERNYTELLQTGLDKVVLLGDMRSSEEGRRAGVVIPGLDAALRWRRIGRIALLGPLALAGRRLFQRPSAQDPVRAFQSQSLVMLRSVQESVMRVQTSVTDIRQEQDRLELGIRRLGERQDEMSVFIDSLRAQMNRLAGGARNGSAAHDGMAQAEQAPATSVAAKATDPQGMQLEIMRKAAAWRT